MRVIRMMSRPLVASAVIAAVCLGGSAALAQPVNDSCASAIVLSSGVPASGSTTGAAFDLPVSCQDGGTDVWYTFTAASPGPYQVTLIAADTTTLTLAVVSGCDFPIAENGCVTGGGAEPLVIRFTAFFAGEQVLVRIGDTSPGTAFSVTAGPLPPPVNDECGGAIPLELSTPLLTDNLAATTSFGLTDMGACQSLSPNFAGVSDVFFSFTPTFSGYVDISSCQSEIDSILSVHSACPASAANMIACNDNGPRPGCGAFDTLSSYVIGMPVTAGSTYYIRVATVVPADAPFIPQARFIVEVKVGQQVLPPANDSCAAAEQLPSDSFTVGSTVLATGGTSSVCGVDDVWDVWYRFTSVQPVTTIFNFEIASGAFDNQATMSAYTDCGGVLLACEAYNPLTNPNMVMSLAVEPGQSVVLRVAGATTAQDDFVMVTLTGPTAANNRSCATAAPLVIGESVNVDLGATTSTLASPCGDGADVYALWYTFQASGTGYYRFSTEVEPDQSQSVITVYGACGDTMPLQCRSQGDWQSTNPLSSAASLRLAAGQRVYLRVSQAFSGRGLFSLVANGPFAPPPTPAHDVCAQAQVINVLPFTSADVDITTAGPDASSCGPASQSLGGLWYRIVAGQDGFLRGTVSTNDARTAQVMFFDGTCNALNELACPDFFLGTPPVPVEAGGSYFALVSVRPSIEDGNVGSPLPLPLGTTLRASFEILVPPANDTCANAARITESPSTVTVDTLLAGPDAPEPSCIGFDGVVNQGVWYVLSTSTAGTLTVHGVRTGGSFLYSPGGALFSGSCGTLVEVACDSPLNGMLISDNFEFEVVLAGNQTYYLLVGMYAGPGGGETEITVDYTGQLDTGSSCPADFNGSGTVSVQDIFDFLSAYFLGLPTADVNDSGSVTVQDIFSYLTLYFIGCP